jgi:hypothetical protein
LKKNQIKTEFCDGNIFHPKIIKLGWNLRPFSVTNHYKKIADLRRFWKGLAAVLNRRKAI